MIAGGRDSEFSGNTPGHVAWCSVQCDIVGGRPGNPE